VTPRTQTCGRTEARTRLEQADAFVVAAELVLEDTTAEANSGVAAALAILAGIAASDAACCARLRRRTRGQAHEEAVALLETVEPGGTEMAKDLKRLLQKKDSASYGLSFIALGEARDLVGWAKRLTGRARTAVEA
jgi:hypothetical protein